MNRGYSRLGARGSLWLCACFVWITWIAPGVAEIYAINRGDAYTWTASYPQSCECEQNGVTSSSCSYFQCNCICDLTAAVCDYGCCCDPDCSSDQINRFESLGVCLTDGTENDQTELCYSSTDLAKINPRSSLTGKSTSQRAVDEALCIYKKNSVFENQFYTNTGLQSSSIFSTSDGEKAYDYIEATPTSTLRDNYYDQNDTITAYYDVTGSDNDFVSYGVGVWQLPQRDYSGYCNDFNLVQFAVDIAPSSESACVREVPSTSTDFASQCNGLWSLNYYVSRLKLAMNADTLYSTLSGVQNVSVTISSVSHRDFATGVTSPVDISTWNVSSCGTKVISSVSETSFEADCGYSLSLELLALLSSTSSDNNNSSSAICRSAVEGVEYKVTYDDTAAATIVSVEASVVLIDIPFTTTSSAQFQQSFGVSFSSSYSGGISQANGNLVARARSGNPGYIVGRPVLYGYGYYNLTESKTTPASISDIVEGFQYSAPFTSFDVNNPSSFGRSLCPTGSQVSLVQQTPLQFGYDVTTGCTMSLNRTELRDLCCQGSSSCSPTMTSPYSNPVTGIPYIFNFTPGYVGIYGNSDPLDISQWFAMSLSTSTAQRVWTDANNICYNMYTGLNFEFLVAKSGEKAYPQNKIVAASATITSANLIYRYPSTTSDNTRQSFPFTITATFVYTNAEDMQGYVPPAPPLLFKVPYDVFYPFQSSAATSSTTWKSGQLIVVCLSSAILIIALSLI